MAISDRLSFALEGAVGSPENRDELVAILNNELGGTNLNIPNSLVKRDGSGNFAANVITVNTLVGNVTGNMTGTATNSTNVATTATNTTNSNFFLAFVSSGTSGNQGVDTATGLTFNPSTNTLTTTTFSGALTGHASLDLALTGGTMSGALNMGSHKVTNVTDPTVAQDAATKNYVDTTVASATLLPITSAAIKAAALAAGLSEDAYFAQTLATGNPSDIRLYIKAAIAAGRFDIKQQMINAYDSVHSRQRPRIAKNFERFVVTQAQINQQFIDLTLGVSVGSARMLVNNIECMEGLLGSSVIGVSTGADYTLNYGGKNPVIYRIYNDNVDKERTTALIPTLTSSPLGNAAGYGLIASSTITNTGFTVVTGNLALYPGTSVTGFPPGTVSGTQNINNAAANSAITDATSYFNTQSALAISGGTAISATLDGQTLTPGTYKTGAATLAQSGAGTLTFNGAGTYIIYTSSTLTTGAGGLPTMTLSGGATAANIYWLVGSSATINSGTAGTFQGNILAQASITDTIGGTVNGVLAALTGAVTLSAAATINSTAATSFYDTSGGPAKYFTIDSGSPDSPHYFWFKVTNAALPGTDPAPGGTGFEVDILMADTAAQVATKLNAVVAAQSTLFTSTVATATVTITNVNIGSVTDATAATSGTTITITTQGQNSNLQNKYMALAGGQYNQFGIGAQPDTILWFNVDSLGAVDTAYLNSQSGFETKINGMVPIQVNITSGSSALTVAQAIATAIRQNVPTLFQITEPSATLAVYNAIGSTTNGSTTITMVPQTEMVTGSGNNNLQITSISAIAPGMPVTGTGIAANTVVISVSGNTVVLNNPATATSTGVYFSFNYLPIKIYNDQYNFNSTDNHVLPVSTLVNTGGRGFNYSSCFQVIGQNGFDNSMTEPGGRIGLLVDHGAGGRNLATVSSPGTIVSGSTRVSNFNMPYRALGAFDQVIRNGNFVTGTGVPAGTTVWQLNLAALGGFGFFSVKRVAGTKDLAVVDAAGNPTTIAAYQTQASSNPSVLTGTLTSVTSTGDLTFNSTTVSNITTTGIVAGMLAQGPYLPGGTTVVTVNVGSLVLSLPALSTFTAQTLLFGNVTGVATQTQTCAVTINSPYITTATGTANLAKLMTLTGTGIPAGAFIVDLSVSGGTTTITMNINATATSASTSLIFSVAPGMLVSGTGIPSGTLIASKTGTTINLTNIPTTTGSQSLSFQPYFPSTTLGSLYGATTLTVSVDTAATVANFIPVRVRTVAGGDVITGNFEMFNDSLMYPYGIRCTLSNDIILSQPVTASSTPVLNFTVANPVAVPGLSTTNLTPLKVGDIINITYDVDDQPVPDYKVELNVPYAGPTWDGTDGTIDTWYQTSTSTITMPYKVKGEGVPILYLGYQTSSESDLYGGNLEFGPLSTGKIYSVAVPGLPKPFGPSVGAFSEANLTDAQAWYNNSPGNPFSDLRLSSVVRCLGALVERFNVGPMLIAAPSRNASVAKALYQSRPDLFRGAIADESFEFHFTPADAYAGTGSVSVWKNVGIQLTAYSTNGTNTLTMGSGGTNNYTLGLYNGMSISGTGILAGTTVSSFTTNSVTMSQNATATAASFLLFGGDLDTTPIRADFIYDYCSSNDPTSSNPNLVTGNVTSGSRVITGITDTTKILKGMSITGTGISGYDTPIGGSITSGSNVISNISAGDIANIQVGMMVWGGGLISNTFTVNAQTLAATNASVVLSKGVSSVIISNTATTTNANALFWFLNHVTATTSTTITLSAPAVATNSGVSIRGRMVNRDSNYYRLIRLNSRKCQEMYASSYLGTAKLGVCGDNLQTAQAYSGAGNITWAQTGGVIPAGASAFKQTASYNLQPPVTTQVDDGTHPNLWFDTSTLPNKDWVSGLISFTFGSAFNVQSPNGVIQTGGPMAFDNGAGVGVDQGSGIYRNTSLSQPFKFYGGRFTAVTIHQRNSLAEGETFSYGATGKYIRSYGNDLPNLTTTQLKNRCTGQYYYRAENSNNWTFTNPLSGFNQSVCIGEAMSWVLGPNSITLASLNPYNDTGSAPINVNAVSTYILNQFYAMLAPGFDGNSREWQVTRNLIKPQL